MGRYNRIDLKVSGHMEEGVAGSAISPGQRITRASDGEYDPAATAPLGVVQIALEDALQGKTVDDAYASGDVVFYTEPKSGDIVAVSVATAQTLVIGDRLIVGTGGNYIKTTGTPAQTDFVCQEALTTSGVQLVKAKKI